MVGDEPAPPVGTPASLSLPAALPALSWLSTAVLLPDPPEPLRPAKPGPSLIAPPGRSTPAPGLSAAPTCLATAPCREAFPPGHARVVCFVCCCMMSLLFCSYVLFAPDKLATSYFAHRQPVALIPYIPRTLIRCKASQFTIAKRRDTCRHRLSSVVPPQETKWTHTPLSGHESRCCSFCNKQAKRRGMWVRNGAECSRLPLVRPSRPVLRAPPGARPRWSTRGRVSRPGGTGRTLCRAVAVTTIRHASSRIRRRAATLVGLIRPRTSWSRTTASLDAVATDPVSNTTTIPGTTPTVVSSALSTGSYCLLVVLQHLGHRCLHGSAGFLALLAQLTAQGQGGRPR